MKNAFNRVWFANDFSKKSEKHARRTGNKHSKFAIECVFLQKFLKRIKFLVEMRKT